MEVYIIIAVLILVLGLGSFFFYKRLKTGHLKLLRNKKIERSIPIDDVGRCEARGIQEDFELRFYNDFIKKNIIFKSENGIITAYKIGNSDFKEYTKRG